MDPFRINITITEPQQTQTKLTEYLYFSLQHNTFVSPLDIYRNPILHGNYRI